MAPKEEYKNYKPSWSLMRTAIATSQENAMTNKTFNIYWIYDAAVHKDFLTEGYVGVSTKSAIQRLKFHTQAQVSGVPGTVSSVKRHLVDEIAKMEDPQAMTLCKAKDEDVAAEIERLLRPTTNVGLNRYPGGKKKGEYKAIYVILEDGTRIDYPSQSKAAYDGFRQGAISANLNGKVSSVKNDKLGRGSFYYA